MAEIHGEMPYIQLKGWITFFDIAGEGRTRRLIGKFTDCSAVIALVRLKGIAFIQDKIKLNTDYIVFGQPTQFGNAITIAHPEIDPVEQAAQVANGLTPFYNTTEKMKKSFLNSRAIQHMQYALLSGLNWQLTDTLHPALLHPPQPLS